MVVVGSYAVSVVVYGTELVVMYVDVPIRVDTLVTVAVFQSVVVIVRLTVVVTGWVLMVV